MFLTNNVITDNTSSKTCIQHRSYNFVANTRSLVPACGKFQSARGV